MTINAATPVGTIATDYPIATRVFARHQIDFCCGGGRPIGEVCESKGLDTAAMLQELRAELEEDSTDPENWNEAPIPELIEYIVTNYHRALEEELPRLEFMARKVLRVHGDKMPEVLPELVSTLLELRSELEDHMEKEEKIVFPMLLKGEGAVATGPIDVLEDEHTAAGKALRHLRELTDDYRVPDGACNTWRALWHGLAALEVSLHQHIHLENNILFPRSLAS
jgi:regulator of cell morphogenesis and NO signaling